MKKREVNEQRNKTDKELLALLLSKKKELVDSSLKVATGELKNTQALRELRRAIAQVKTVMREKTLGGEQ